MHIRTHVENNDMIHPQQRFTIADDLGANHQESHSAPSILTRAFAVRTVYHNAVRTGLRGCSRKGRAAVAERKT
jgi:hypothetical protein